MPSENWIKWYLPCLFWSVGPQPELEVELAGLCCSDWEREQSVSPLKTNNNNNNTYPNSMGCGLNCKQTKTFTTGSWNIDVYPVVVSIIQEPTLIKSLKWDAIASFIYIINDNLAHFYSWSLDVGVGSQRFQCDPELQLFTWALQQGTEPKIAPEAVFLWININNWVFKLSVWFTSVCMKASLKGEMDDWDGEAVWVVQDDKKCFCYQTQEKGPFGTDSFLDIVGGGNQKLWFLEQRYYLAMDTLFRQKVEHRSSFDSQQSIMMED